MNPENPKAVEVGQMDKSGAWAQVADGNFVTVEYPEPQFGLAAARNVNQLLAALGRNAPAQAAAPADDGAPTGRTASKADVDAARKKS